MRRSGYILVGILALSVFIAALPVRIHASILLVPSPQYPTIQSAVDAATIGDTISISAGTYPGALVIKTPGITLLGASRNTTIIDGQGSGSVVWINASNVALSGFTIRNAADHGWGVHVEYANGVNITNNSISSGIDGDAVNLYNANNTLVDRNIFTNNLYAVNVTSSHFDRVTNNEAISGNIVGVQLESSSNCLIFHNSFIGGQDGVDIIQSSSNNITRNLVKDMSISGVALETDSSSTPPSQFSQNNTLTENTFQRDHIGVRLQNATQNTFYNNGFFQSGFKHIEPVASSTGPPPTLVIVFPNYWDNRSLGGMGGNYWDNFISTDSNHDGVWDTSYDIGRGNIDTYPLTAPFVPEPVLIRAIVATPNRGSAPLTVTLSATVASSLQFDYSWSFGDGSATSSLASSVHVFTQPGNYSVTLTVHDTGGNEDSESVQVSVSKASAQNLTILLAAGGVASGLLAAGLVIAWRRKGRLSHRARTITSATLKVAASMRCLAPQYRKHGLFVTTRRHIPVRLF